MKSLLNHLNVNRLSRFQKLIKLFKRTKQLVFLGLVLVLAGFGVYLVSATYGQNTDGPVGYWSFDEGYGTVVQDRTSNNNDGTFGGAPTWQHEDMCISGKCLYFDGNDNLSIPDDPVLTPSNQATVEMWARAGETGFTNRITIAKGDSLTSSPYSIKINNFAHPTFYLYTSALYSTGESLNLSINKWYYFVGTYDGSNIKFYLDGVEKISEIANGSLLSNSSPLTIGSALNGSYFDGFIDEVKIYNYARTPAQIKADYNSGTSKGAAFSISGNVSPDTPGDIKLSDGLAGYWKMDEGSWGAVTDSSGNGNDGTAQGDAVPGVGKFGNGGSFDGDGDYITVANVFGGSAATVPFTASAWIYPTVVSGWNTVMGEGCTGFDLAVANSRLYFGRNCGGGVFYNTGASSISVDQWYHVVAVYDGTNIDAYIDGIKYSGGAVNYTHTQLNIGSYHDNGAEFFDGTIDEVRIYNRALSSREVNTLYEWAPGPVGHWKMDEASWSGISGEVKDSSGYGNNGTRGGDATTLIPGKYGRAGTFDGAGDYIEGVSSNIIIGDNLQTITMSAWVKINSNQLTSHYIASLKRASGSHSTLLSLASNYVTTGDLGFLTRNYDNSTHTSLMHNENYNDDEWHYVTAVVNGLTRVLYIDGIQRGTDELGIQSVSGNTDNFFIGSFNESSSLFFNGLIDDVRIYNYARTQKQILEDMAGGRPAQKQMTGHWSFDEGDSDIVKDLSSYGNDGTRYGATWTNAGKFRKAMSFDGSSYIAVGDSDFSEGAEPFSFSLWMKPSATGTPFFYGTKSTNSGVVTYYDISNSKTRFGRWGNDILTPTITQSLNEWSHIAYVYDGSTLSAYVNSSFAGSTTVTLTTVLNAGYIGSAGTSQYFSGLIDEVKIFNYALTHDEIKTEYNSGQTAVMGTGPSSSLSDSSIDCIPGDVSSCSSPVGEWKFEEHSGAYVYDTSANGNTGTFINGLSSHWQSSGSCHEGSCLYFDGGENDNYVSVTDSADGELDFGYNSFTMEAWWKSPADVNDEITAFGKIQETGSIGFALLPINNKAGIYIGSASNVQGLLTPGTTNVCDNQWHHVVVVVDRSNETADAYVDGKFDGSTALHLNLGSVTNTANLFIGSNKNQSNYFTGYIDHVRLYDYARTPAQIAWDYNKGKPIAYWKFDECQNTTIYDRTGNGNNGTITIGNSGTQTSAGSCSTTDTATAWYNGRDGKLNSSLNFDGTDDYVDVGTGNGFLHGQVDATWSAWVKSNDNINYRAVITRWNNSGTTNWWFGLASDGRIHLYSGAGAYSSNSAYSNDDNWYNIVAVKDGTVVNFYSNGIAVGTGNAGATVNDDSESLLIGAKNNGVDDKFNGQIDEVKIYNYALTSLQIKSEFNLGAARLGTGN